MDATWYANRLSEPVGPVRVVIDTDAGNQIDDQFAITYALLSPDVLDVQAIYAAPFVRRNCTSPAEGMRASFGQITDIIDAFVTDCPALSGCMPSVFQGADRWISPTGQPVPSPAVSDLIERVMGWADDQPLYVVAIGAITNIASALMIEPALAEKIVVVWLAGQSHNAKDTHEYNLAGDILASQWMFDCGVPVVQIPCNGVADSLRTGAENIDPHLRKCGAIGRLLKHLYQQLDPRYPHTSKVLWDLAPVAWLIDPAWLPGQMTASPKLDDSLNWRMQDDRHPMRLITDCRADDIYADLFKKLDQHAELLS